MTGASLLLVGIILFFSALLSAADSATHSLSASRVRTLVDEGFRGADRLNEVRREGASVRASVFVVTSLLDLAAVGLLVAGAMFQMGGAVLPLAVPVAAIGVLIISVGVPRLVAARQSIRLALLSAPVLMNLERWVRPLIAPLMRLEEIVGRRNGNENGAASEQLRELTELGRREGVVEEEEHELVERAFRMDELSAWDIMTPRVDIFAWKDSLTLEEIVNELQSVPFSRVPVYADSIDNITGILYVREAYDAYVKGHPKLPLGQLSRDPFFVPGSLSLPELLHDFQARRIHMGIVADEFGGTDGLVTLEDVIEELVGEIEDETDISEVSIHRISRDELEVAGGVELREINYAFNVSLPHLDHRSLNGFILEELGRVPEKGEEIGLPGLEIEVVDATDSQVLRARIRKTQVAPAKEG